MASAWLSSDKLGLGDVKLILKTSESWLIEPCMLLRTVVCVALVGCLEVVARVLLVELFDGRWDKEVAEEMGSSWVIAEYLRFPPELVDGNERSGVCTRTSGWLAAALPPPLSFTLPSTWLESEGWNAWAPRAPGLGKISWNFSWNSHPWFRYGRRMLLDCNYNILATTQQRWSAITFWSVKVFHTVPASLLSIPAPLSLSQWNPDWFR